MKKISLSTEIEVYTWDELSSEDKILIEKAKKTLDSSYSPYSRFQVGCAVKLKSGVIVTGSNQENAAYTAGMCAERTAINYATSCYPDDPVTTVAIIARQQGKVVSRISPCGECRQVINEVEKRTGKPIKLILAGENEIYKINSIQTLLPLSFNL